VEIPLKKLSHEDKSNDYKIFSLIEYYKSDYEFIKQVQYRHILILDSELFDLARRTHYKRKKILI